MSCINLATGLPFAPSWPKIRANHAEPYITLGESKVGAEAASPQTFGRARGLVLGARGIATGGKKSYSASDYIQDGLVAIWDALENDGWGQFDENKGNAWYDLVGNRKMSGWGWNSTCGWTGGSFCPLNRAHGSSFSVSIANGATCEVCHLWFNASNQNIQSAGIYPNWGVTGDAYVIFGSSTKYRLTSSDGNPTKAYLQYIMSTQATSQATIIGTDGSAEAYSPGSQLSSKVASATTETSLTFLPWSMTKTCSTSVGAPCASCIRLYNRALTHSEIDANYAIDKARFGLA